MLQKIETKNWDLFIVGSSNISDTYPGTKVLVLCVWFVRRTGGRAAVERILCRRRADIRIGIPVYHIRLRAVLIWCIGATYDEALPRGWQWGHSSSHHHRGTLRSAVRPAAFMHHYTWYWNNQNAVLATFLRPCLSKRHLIPVDRLNVSFSIG